MAELIMQEEGSTPATPSSGKWKAYFKSDGIHVIDDAGVESGPFATLTGSEVLSGKTLTTPTIGSFVNAGHTHADAAGGGSILNPVNITLQQVAATLASDIFTFASSFMIVDTESAAATDNCTTINSGPAALGTILIVRQANSARDITFVDGAPLRLAGNCALTTVNDFLVLMCTASNVWCELSRSING